MKPSHIRVSGALLICMAMFYYTESKWASDWWESEQVKKGGKEFFFFSSDHCTGPAVSWDPRTREWRNCVQVWYRRGGGSGGLLNLVIEYMYLFHCYRSFHTPSRVIMAVKVTTCDTAAWTYPTLRSVTTHLPINYHTCTCSWRHILLPPHLLSQVLPLDATVDEQRQIMSELEILHKVKISG